MTILKTRRGRTTLLLSGAALALALIPWQSTVRAPAIMRPALQTEVFPQEAARLVSVRAENGQAVTKGAVIAVLWSDDIENETAMTREELALTRAQLARRGSDAQDLSLSAVLLQAEQRDIAKLEGLKKAKAALVIRAPHDGIVSDISRDLHIGRFIKVTDRIARISAPGATEIIAFPKEADARRLDKSETLKFIPDNLLGQSEKARITDRALTGETYLKEDLLSGEFYGPIAVTPDSEGNAVPTSAIFRVTAKAERASEDLRAVRGVAVMRAKRQSPAASIFRRIGQVLIRETDF